MASIVNQLAEGASYQDFDRTSMLTEMIEDPLVFCYALFGDSYFKDKTIPWFHRGIIAIMTRNVAWLPQYGEMDKIARHFIWTKDGEQVPLFYEENGRWKMRTGDHTNIRLFRGAAKTTICGVVIPLYKVLYKLRKHIVCISESADHAETQLMNVKRELEHNDKLKYFFGDLTQGGYWRADAFECSNGAALVARGFGSQIRGALRSADRPDEIIIDDLETKQSVMSDLQRKRYRNWLVTTVLPALAKVDDDPATITYLNSKKHEDDIGSRLQYDSNFATVMINAIDRDGELVFPSKVDKKQLKKEQETARTMGELREWWMEYFPDPSYAAPPPDDQLFHPGLFQVKRLPTVLRTAMAVDPAIGKGRDADEATVYVAGIDDRGMSWVLDCWHARGCHHNELLGALLDLRYKWNVAWERIGIESNGYQGVLSEMLPEFTVRYCTERKLAYPHNVNLVCSVHSKHKKTERIRMALAPRYGANGGPVIFHARPFPMLEAQLVDFPYGKHDDHPDCLAMAFSMLTGSAIMAAGFEGGLERNRYEPLPEGDTVGLPMGFI